VLRTQLPLRRVPLPNRGCGNPADRTAVSLLLDEASASSIMSWSVLPAAIACGPCSTTSESNILDRTMQPWLWKVRWRRPSTSFSQDSKMRIKSTTSTAASSPKKSEVPSLSWTSRATFVELQVAPKQRPHGSRNSGPSFARQ